MWLCVGVCQVCGWELFERISTLLGSRLVYYYIWSSVALLLVAVILSGPVLWSDRSQVLCGDHEVWLTFDFNLSGIILAYTMVASIRSDNIYILLVTSSQWIVVLKFMNGYIYIYIYIYICNTLFRLVFSIHNNILDLNSFLKSRYVPKILSV